MPTFSDLSLVTNMHPLFVLQKWHPVEHSVTICFSELSSTLESAESLTQG